MAFHWIITPVSLSVHYHCIFVSSVRRQLLFVLSTLLCWKFSVYSFIKYIWIRNWLIFVFGLFELRQLQPVLSCDFQNLTELSTTQQLIQTTRSIHPFVRRIVLPLEGDFWERLVQQTMISAKKSRKITAWWQ